MIIDSQLIDSLTAQAKASPRLRMNYNFHRSLESGTVLFESKEGPFIPHESEGLLVNPQPPVEG